MITNAIISILYAFVYSITAIFSILPDVSLPADLLSGIDSFKPYYLALDEILPMGTVIAIITFDVLFESSLLAYKLIRWAYQKVPGIN